MRVDPRAFDAEASRRLLSIDQRVTATVTSQELSDATRDRLDVVGVERHAVTGLEPAIGVSFTPTKPTRRRRGPTRCPVSTPS